MCIREHLAVHPRLPIVWRDAYRKPKKLSPWRLGVLYSISTASETRLPLRKTSANLSSLPLLQAALKERMRVEIGAQTWRFPAKDLSRMLSAKVRKQDAPLHRPGDIDRLEHYEIALDNLESELDKTTRHFESLELSVGKYLSERESYEPLTKFLNAAVHAVVSQLPGSLLAPLHFHVWDKPVSDKIDHAAYLQPDGVGVFQKSLPVRVYWGWPQDSDGVTIEFPVEDKDDWPELIVQAATHARAMFRTNPLRSHVIVLAFNYKQGNTRFLVFHRGGLTASDPLPLFTQAGQRDFLRVLFSLFTWKTPGDAGFPIWYNGTEMSLLGAEMLPLPFSSVQIDSVLYKSICVRGLAPHVYTFQHRVATNNTIPPASETSRIKWPSKKSTDAVEIPSITVPHAQEVHSVNQNVRWLPPSPPVLAKDTSYVTKFSWGQSRSTGGLLVKPNLRRSCGGLFGVPKDMYSLITHHMEHSPSTNHLLLPPPGHAAHAYRSELLTVEKEEPEYRSLLCHVIAFAGHSLEEASSLEALMCAILHAHIGYYNMCINDYQLRDLSIGNVLMVDEAIECRPFSIPSPNGTQSKILELCQELKIDKRCFGFVVDGDMAAGQVYFAEGDITTKSGTSEFISDDVLDSPEGYIHSPIDDYQSLYYVAQWACVFNTRSEKDSSVDRRIQEIRADLSGDYKIRAFATSRIISPTSGTSQYGAWVARAQPFFNEWHRSFHSIREKGSSILKSKGHNKKTFRQCADLGLLSFLRLARKHKHFFSLGDT
ncbi:hypothetical protein BDP27DRAFT_1435139 [Rhodocollybia butyracea]|uniref:Fungal-type protein kinase domain-containing protein n=1 Tax=Rhodocollybia butyracea TaxID=206335 RepID=A0A9P5TWJ4_9AGAR|nr:hypothetical protein BDP27DRAFT_1435139 [Rhodocollybia butyracea]